MIIEGSDYSKQGEVKRTIVDLIDVENGEFVNAIDILTEEKYRDKAVFAKMKETLVLAQKTGIHKYYRQRYKIFISGRNRNRNNRKG